MTDPGFDPVELLSPYPDPPLLIELAALLTRHRPRTWRIRGEAAYRLEGSSWAIETTDSGDHYRISGPNTRGATATAETILWALNNLPDLCGQLAAAYAKLRRQAADTELDYRHIAAGKAEDRRRLSQVADFINQRPHHLAEMARAVPGSLDYLEARAHAVARRDLATRLGWTVPALPGETTEPAPAQGNPQ